MQTAIEYLAHKTKEWNGTAEDVLCSLKFIVADLDLTVRVAELNALQEALTRDRFTVIVFGRSKVGKSMLVNALLGKSEIPITGLRPDQGPIPTDPNPSRTLLTKIYYAEKPEVFAIRGSGNDSEKQEWTLEEFHGSQFRGQRPWSMEEINGFEIGLPSTLCRAGIDIVEVPSSEEDHVKEMITVQAAVAADVAVLAMTHPCTMGRLECDYLAEIKNIPSTFLLTVINARDPEPPSVLAMPPSTQTITVIWNRIVAPLHQKPSYQGERLESEDVFFLNAYQAFKGRLSGNENAIEKSGISGFEDRLAECLQIAARYVHLQGFMGTIIAVLDSADRALQFRNISLDATQSGCQSRHAEILLKHQALLTPNEFERMLRDNSLLGLDPKDTSLVVNGRRLAEESVQELLADLNESRDVRNRLEGTLRRRSELEGYAKQILLLREELTLAWASAVEPWSNIKTNTNKACTNSEESEGGMPTTEMQYSQGPVGLNWSTQCLQMTIDFEPIMQFANRANAFIERLRQADEALARQLEFPIDQITATCVTVTFGGRFKAGKSMLLNRLLKRAILPVNVEAETGAPCLIEAAVKDRAVAFQNESSVEIPCTTESLEEQLSLWRRSVGQSQKELALRVEIELAGVPIPPYVRWVDTPGVDDSAAMDAASLAVIRRTDVLIWVLNSEAPLSSQEMDYVRGFVEEAGPRGVIFITNVFIRDHRTYEENWQKFVDHQLPALCNRIKESTETMGFDGYMPRMLAVCGAAIGDAPFGEFGAASAKDLLGSISSRSHALVSACRLQRASRVFDGVSARLDERFKEAAALAESVEANRAEWDRAAGITRSSFERKVDTALEALMVDFRRFATEAVQTIAASVTGAAICRDSTYKNLLNSELSEAINKSTAVFAENVNEAARGADQVCEEGNFLSKIRKEIPTPSCDVTVPDTPIKMGRAVGPAMIGAGVIAGIFTFGIGTAVAAAAAAVRIKMEADNAVAVDVASAKASINFEADKVLKQASSWKKKVHATTLQLYQPVDTPPPRAERSKESILMSLSRDLRALAQDADRLATEII